MSGTAALHAAKGIFAQAGEVGAAGEVEEVEQPHQQDERAQCHENDGENQETALAQEVFAEGLCRHRAFIRPERHLQALLQEGGVQSVGRETGPQQGTDLSAQEVVRLPESFVVAQLVVHRQQVHRFHSRQGVVGGQVPHDGLHGVGHVAGHPGLPGGHHPPGIGQQHRPPDGLGGLGKEAACHLLGQDDGVARACRGLPRAGQQFPAKHAVETGVRLQHIQILERQFLARSQHDSIVALVARVHVGHSLHPGGQLGGQAVGQGDAAGAEGRAVFPQQLDVRDAFPQAHAQPHDADQVLRPVFQQLPDGDFQVM